MKFLGLRLFRGWRKQAADAMGDAEPGNPAERLRATLRRLDGVLEVRVAEPDLTALSLEELDRLLRDRAQATSVRRVALRHLASRLRAEAALSAILRGVLNDADELLVCDAIRASAPFDAGLRQRIAALLDDPRPAVWSEAASVLARRMDPAVAPRLLVWFQSDDREKRRVGVAGLACVLKPEAAIDLFQPELDRGGRDADDRENLTAALHEARRRAEGRRKVFGGDDEEDAIWPLGST
jgi:hypothetical protein